MCVGFTQPRACWIPSAIVLPQVGIPSSWCDLEHWPADERSAFAAAKAAGGRVAAPARPTPEVAAAALLAMRSRLSLMLDTEELVASM